MLIIVRHRRCFHRVLQRILDMWFYQRICLLAPYWGLLWSSLSENFENSSGIIIYSSNLFIYFIGSICQKIISKLLSKNSNLYSAIGRLSVIAQCNGQIQWGSIENFLGLNRKFQILKKFAWKSEAKILSEKRFNLRRFLISTWSQPVIGTGELCATILANCLCEFVVYFDYRLLFVCAMHGAATGV